MYWTLRFSFPVDSDKASLALRARFKALLPIECEARFSNRNQASDRSFVGPPLAQEAHPPSEPLSVLATEYLDSCAHTPRHGPFARRASCNSRARTKTPDCEIYARAGPAPPPPLSRSRPLACPGYGSSHNVSPHRLVFGCYFAHYHSVPSHASPEPHTRKSVLSILQ